MIEYKIIEDMKTARKNKNLTQKELAEKAGITREYLSLVENHHKSPTLHIVESISLALDQKGIEV